VDARIGIGAVLVDDVVLRFSSSREQDTARADQLLREALAREMNSSMAHFAMGVLRRIQVRLNDSQIELQTAIALDRNNARAYQQLGLTLMWLGQPDAAIPQIEKAIRLNPRDPNIASYCWALGSADLVSDRIDDAVLLQQGTRRKSSTVLYPFLACGIAGSKGRSRRVEVGLGGCGCAKTGDQLPGAVACRKPLVYPSQFVVLAEKTLYAGLRRAGFPKE
jgi:tetratricopeptide (TPR) repeat protein